jgi:high-affinity Fe2+/Pb2+ permease
VAGSFLGWGIGKGLVGGSYHAHPWVWVLIGSILVVLIISAIARRRSLASRWGGR